MKNLLVVFLVLVNYNEFCYQQPTMTVNIGDINANVKINYGGIGVPETDDQSGNGTRREYQLDQNSSHSKFCISQCLDDGQHNLEQCAAICRPQSGNGTRREYQLDQDSSHSKFCISQC